MKLCNVPPQLTFTYSTHERLNCALIRDLLATMQAVGGELLENAEGTVRTLTPKLILTGSIREKTRILLANELDISLEFAGWRNKKPPFVVKDEDPFHLHRFYRVVHKINLY